MIGFSGDTGVEEAAGPSNISALVEQCLRELVEAANIKPDQVIVIGTSTSEIAGKHIGTEGSMDVAEAIFTAVNKVRSEMPFHVAFQCCEHLNRALVVERSAMERYGWEEVTVVPVRKAGGAMAAYAYRHLNEACVVENIAAHAGIDIGDTLMGMHLRPVAVPVRPTVRAIGQAHVTMARTRPKLIGGERAVYSLREEAD